MTDTGILTRDQQEVIDTLAGIGPDTLCSDFFSTYLLHMKILVKVLEGGDRNKYLRKALTYRAMALLVALLKLHPRPFERVSVGKRDTFISPAKLARMIREELSQQLRSDRSKRVMQDVLRLVASTIPLNKLQESLLVDDGILRPLNTIKKSITDPARPLEALGLIEIEWKDRGSKKKFVMAGLSLTSTGMEFITSVFNHSISRSAERHPSFEKNEPESLDATAE
jgi:hypothetical protein